MLTTLALPAVNRVLRTNPWALERLRAYAGKTAQIEVGVMRSLLLVREDGELARPPHDALPDVIIRMTPGRALRVLARDEAVWSEIEVQGDSGFAATLSQLSRELKWDVEEDLAAIFGDIAAHRMADAGRRTLAWGRYAARSATHTIAEYWTEERPLVTRGRDLARFNAEVDQLRDDVARLEKRVRALASRLEKNAGGGTR